VRGTDSLMILGRHSMMVVLPVLVVEGRHSLLLLGQSKGDDSSASMLKSGS